MGGAVAGKAGDEQLCMRVHGVATALATPRQGHSGAGQ